MSNMNKIERTAAQNGIAPFDEVRKEIIKVRDRNLNFDNFEEAVLLSHVIWWLTTMNVRLLELPEHE